MPVPEQTPVSTFTGNGVTTDFSFAWGAGAAAHVAVEVDGAELAQGVGYTVTAIDGNNGTVQITPAPASGAQIIVFRSTPLERTTDYQEAGPFLAKTIDEDVDGTWRALQDVRRDVGRAPLLRKSSQHVGKVTLPEPVASKIIGWNEDADDLELFDWESPAYFAAQRSAAESAASSANSSAIASAASASYAAEMRAIVGSLVAATTPTVVRFSGDGAQKDFTLPVTPGAEENTQVYVAGVYQQKDTYAVTGSTLSLSAAPASGTNNIEVVIGPSMQLVIASALGVMFTQAGTGAVARTAQAKLRETVSVQDFGAAGDGVSDDTAAVAAALNSGAKRVLGAPGKTYLLRKTGVFQLNGVDQPYCVLIPAGVTLDANGAAFKLADSQNAALFAANGVDGPGLVNANIDGNQSQQTAPSAGSMPCVHFYNCTKPRVENVTVSSAREYAGRFLACSRGTFSDLRCFDSYGDGWSFGVDGGYAGQVTYSRIDKVYAENCLGTYPGLEGNPAIFTVQHCTVGAVVAKDCAAGIKIQDSSLSSSFGQLVFDGANNGTSNSGIKVQGNSGAGVYPRGISIDSAVASNCYGEGLYVMDCFDIAIGRYVGRDNGRVSSSRDVRIDGDRVSIGSILSYAPTAGAGYAVVVTGAGRYSIGEIKAHNANRVFQVTGAANVEVGSIRSSDDQGVPTLTRVVDVSNTAARVHIRSVATDVPPSTAQSRLAAAIVDGLLIDRFTQSTDPTEGIVTLTAGTTTSVANANVFRVYVGGSSYLQPIIGLVPANAAAAALAACRVSATVDFNVGTGFTITHSTAAGTEKFVWKVLGWKILSAAFA